MAAHFTWEVVPPTATSKNEDPLYDDWKQHTQACTALKEKLVNRTRDLSELNPGWDDEFANYFDDASALKISLARLAEFEETKPSMELTPKARQALTGHLQAWLEEADNARKLLNHALLVQDWLVARTKHTTRIKDAQAKLEQPPLPKPSDDAESEAKANFTDQQKERTKLENELTRLQKELGDKYHAAPADKSEHAELKNLRPLDKSGLKPCPTETLPVVGKLYAGKGAGGQPARFLAIADWPDHDEGLKEAGRLKAALVAETP
jgi:chromosome segregation ATPase